VERSGLDPVAFMKSAMWFHELAFLGSEATSRIAKHLARNIQEAFGSTV
jgi:hypothetical protein